MTPKRRDYLKQKCHDNAVYLNSAIDQGKLIPRLDTIVEMYKILEEIVKVCPTEPG